MTMLNFQKITQSLEYYTNDILDLTELTAKTKTGGKTTLL
jgi:hypothetical protein